MKSDNRASGGRAQGRCAHPPELDKKNPWQIDSKQTMWSMTRDNLTMLETENDGIHTKFGFLQKVLSSFKK
ncbi:hypothetical protein NQ318_013360 [Aromia moschata]|uniref:Uncharacterized protein n=1 Tax=Aromia moschata TaxID=1265417 RepID=A0AAV8XU56_9CUCU|nr:hypothetical protein NQ318_013360 [Aromia moschata]